MWAIKWFLGVIVILAILGFALANSSEQVKVVFFPNIWQYEKVQLWMVIYLSFCFGVFFWLTISVFQVLQLKSEMRKIKKTNQEMQGELDNLRNLPIGEEDTGFDIKEET